MAMQRKACPTHKVKFRTQLDAKIVLAKRIRQDKGELREYRCPRCGAWHLTSQEKRAA